MSEYEDIFRCKELHDIYISGDIRSLDDLYLLEDVALTIKDFDKKIDFYEGYKKKKFKDIQDEIKVLKNKIEFYKSVMVLTLEKNKEKSVKFPGSCSISTRSHKAKWVVNDEEEFIAVLQAAQKSGEDVDDVLEKVIQYNVRKREASKLLEIWEQSGKLDGFLKNAKKSSRDVIQKEPQKTTVSIKFLEEVEEGDNVEDIVNDISIPVKNSVDVEDYDCL